MISFARIPPDPKEIRGSKIRRVRCELFSIVSFVEESFDGREII